MCTKIGISVYSNSGVFKCTVLLSVTLNALQAFKILLSSAGMREKRAAKQELPSCREPELQCCEGFAVPLFFWSLV